MAHPSIEEEDATKSILIIIKFARSGKNDDLKT